MTPKETGDGSVADVESFSEVNRCLAGYVKIVKLLRIDKKFFHGYVYNISCDNQFYSANGIIAHNCECALVANVVDDEDDAEKVEKADDRRRVARVIILEDDGRVWLFAPFNEPYVMFPGGGVDDGETFIDAAMREVREETGLEVEITHSLGEFDDEFARRQYYVARRTGGEPTVVDEDGGGLVRVYRATFDEAMAQLTSPHDRAALTLWMEEKDNGKP